MIDALDIPTLAFVTAVVMMAVAGTLCLVYFTREVYPGFGYWVLWQLGMVAGTLVFVGRGPDPSPLELVATNALLLGSTALLFSGLARFHKLYTSTLPELANIGVVAVALMLQGYFSFVDSDLDARVVVYALTQAILQARCAIEPLRLSGARRSPSFWLMSLILLALVAANLHHAWRGLQPGPIEALDDNLNIRLALILVVVADVLGTYCLLLLTGERLETDLHLARQDIDKLARTDTLTGLWNRRHFEDMAEVEIERARRNGAPLSLLTFDADHFKRVNDQHGHHAGDAVLREIADLVGTQIRKGDILCRWGGEEFMVLAPGADRGRAAAMAEKIQRAVAGHRFTAIGSMTVSLGVGQIHDGETAEDWVRRVDAALYDAKQGGRNRVVVSEDGDRVAV